MRVFAAKKLRSIQLYRIVAPVIISAHRDLWPATPFTPPLSAKIRRFAKENDAGFQHQERPKVSRRDWKHSQRIDLSDAGILADLEKHGSKDADALVLGR